MTKENTFVLRITARPRTGTGPKSAVLNRLTKEMFNDAPAVRLYVEGRMIRQLEEFAGGAVEILKVMAAEQEWVEYPLSQERFDSDPVWAEYGYKPGDMTGEWLTIGSFDLTRQWVKKNV